VVALTKWDYTGIIRNKRIIIRINNGIKFFFLFKYLLRIKRDRPRNYTSIQCGFSVLAMLYVVCTCGKLHFFVSETCAMSHHKHIDLDVTHFT